MQSKNPFVLACLHENSLLSASTVCRMEEAWDKAIEAVLANKDKHGKISVGKVKLLMSTKQRHAGVPQPEPKPPMTRDLSNVELDIALGTDDSDHRLAFEQAHRGGGTIGAIKYLRAQFNCSLFSGKRFVDYYPFPPTPATA